MACGVGEILSTLGSIAMAASVLFAQGAKDGTLTDADIAKVRAQFDADLDDFNEPMGK
jgi:hypothetical protein